MIGSAAWASRIASPTIPPSPRTRRALAARGIGLVYGGTHKGLMGVVANAVLDAGGTVTGIINAADGRVRPRRGAKPLRKSH